VKGRIHIMYVSDTTFMQVFGEKFSRENSRWEIVCMDVRIILKATLSK
jgi:hypothetical protein